MNSLAALLAACAVLAACGGGSDSPTTPSNATPPPRTCETNNTGEITFENRSNSGATYAVIWDGFRLAGTIAPGQTTQPMTVPAGEHRAAVIFTHNGHYACGPTTITIERCVARNMACNG